MACTVKTIGNSWGNSRVLLGVSQSLSATVSRRFRAGGPRKTFRIAIPIRHDSPHDERRRLVKLALPGIRHRPQRRATGRHQTRWRCRLAQMREDVARGHRLGDEGDDPHPKGASCGAHLTATLGTEERKDLVDAGEQQRPCVTGHPAVDRFFRPLGRCARWGGRRRSISSSGVSIRLTLPPGPDQRAQQTDAHLALYFGKRFGTEAGQAIICS